MKGLLLWDSCIAMSFHPSLIVAVVVESKKQSQKKTKRRRKIKRAEQKIIAENCTLPADVDVNGPGKELFERVAAVVTSLDVAVVKKLVAKGRTHFLESISEFFVGLSDDGTKTVETRQSQQQHWCRYDASHTSHFHIIIFTISAIIVFASS